MLRALARRVLPPNLAYHAWLQVFQLRERGFRFTLAWNTQLARGWTRDRRGRAHYVEVDAERARARRTSDTVFVFGCGASLNDLTDEEWAHIAEHDTFGFNEFFRQRWVPVGFHLLRQGVDGSLRQRPYAEHVARGIAESPHYERTLLLLQEGWLAELSNELVGGRLLPPGRQMLRYRTARGAGPPSANWGDGLRHVVGTLDDTVNAAYALGWRRIVLTGVDLYDSRYFWLPPNLTSTTDPATGASVAAERNRYRGNRYDETHSTAANGVVAIMDGWRGRLEADGVELSVYNPRSLLAEALPVYARPQERARPVERP